VLAGALPQERVTTWKYLSYTSFVKRLPAGGGEVNKIGSKIMSCKLLLPVVEQAERKGAAEVSSGLYKLDSASSDEQGLMLLATFRLVDTLPPLVHTHYNSVMRHNRDLVSAGGRTQ